MDAERWAAEEQRKMARMQEIADTLPASLPTMTRIIMAGDLAGAERVRREVEAGTLEPGWKSLVQCGSYARIAHLVWLVETGRVDRTEAVTKHLPTWWPSSDPDDTDPKLLELWHEARFLTGDVVLDDATKPLPRKGAWLTIYRGQMPSDPVGFAWSLKRDVALRFAKGASLRIPVKGGILIRSVVPRKAILAYLTGRDEAEVIVDPKSLSLAHTYREVAE